MVALREMCAQFPKATVVVDHFSNLVGELGEPSFGVDNHLIELATFPNVYQKFTMINVKKMDDLGLTCAPIVKRMVEVYGASRVMWGSDVAQSKGTYAEIVMAGKDATCDLAEAERNQVLFETGNAVYGRNTTK